MNPKSSNKIFLQPGEIFFGKAPMAISTLLGSCVSATIWHPQRLLGGMCHILLPKKTAQVYDTKFAECAVDYFLSNIISCKSLPCEYQLRLYGGGNMFPHIKKNLKSDVGKRNIAMMRQYLREAGFIVRKGLDDVGGKSYRRLALNLATGVVYINSTEVAQEYLPLKDSGNV